MKLSIFFILCFVLNLFVLSKQVSDEEAREFFFSELKRHHLVYTLPDGMEEVELYERTFFFGYQFALKCTLGKFEMRYVIESMEFFMSQFKDALNDPNTHLFDPNMGVSQDLSVFATNIVHFEGTNINDAPKPQLYMMQQEPFNATTALMSDVFIVSRKFTQGFDYAFATLIHKKNVAKFYSVALFDEPEDMQKCWEVGKKAFSYVSESEDLEILEKEPAENEDKVKKENEL